MNKNIDHTNLKAYATIEDITKLCEEAIKYNFKAVCVHPYYVPLAKDILKNTIGYSEFFDFEKSLFNSPMHFGFGFTTATKR